MIRAYEEEGREELEEDLEGASAMPQADGRARLCEGLKVPPLEVVVEELSLEGRPIHRRGPRDVAHEAPRGRLRLLGIPLEERGGLPMGSREVLRDERQVPRGLVRHDAVQLEGLGVACLGEDLVAVDGQEDHKMNPSPRRPPPVLEVLRGDLEAL